MTISQFAQIVTHQWSEERASFTSFAMECIPTNTQPWATIKKIYIFLSNKTLVLSVWMWFLVS